MVTENAVALQRRQHKGGQEAPTTKPSPLSACCTLLPLQPRQVVHLLLQQPFSMGQVGAGQTLLPRAVHQSVPLVARQRVTRRRQQLLILLQGPRACKGCGGVRVAGKCGGVSW